MNGSPLHDGAVIINGDRVLAAACLLPLSQNPNVSLSLGTRHRAAIGMSEDSDARGAGRIRGERDNFACARRCAEPGTGAGRGSVDAEEAAGLGARRKERRTTHDEAGRFQISVCGSVAAAPRQQYRPAHPRAGARGGLWIFVNAGERGRSSRSQCRSVTASLPQGMVIVNHPPDEVKIEVTGPRTLLSLLDPQRLTLKIDLRSVASGQSEFKVYPAMFNVGRNTTVTSISPDQLSLDIDRIVTRDVPVHLAVAGQGRRRLSDFIGRDYAAERHRVGPSRYVAPLISVSTEPLDLNGLNANRTFCGYRAARSGDRTLRRARPGENKRRGNDHRS